MSEGFALWISGFLYGSVFTHVLIVRWREQWEKKHAKKRKLWE